jgi:uncharacterized protein YndB with AHSA1/START domain
MSIAPLLHSVEVKAAPHRAFELFTGCMGQWWPRGKTVGRNPHVDVVMEPREGGRWFERDEQGNETEWGKVLAWEPPSRVLLAWQLNTEWSYDPNLITEVELSFVQLAGGGTRVTLEHRNLERFGKDAAAHSDKLRGGWPTLVGHFANYAGTHA